MAARTPLNKCLALASSGSSGAPIKVYHDRRSALLAAAHNERYRAVIAGLAGKRRNYRETAIDCPDGTPARHRGFWLGLTLGMNKLIPRKQLLSVFDPPEKNIPLFSAFKPDVLLSFGSYFEVLFARLASWTEPYTLPKVAAYGADGLSSESRRLMRDHFGVEITSSYGAVEAQRIGFECEGHTGIHLNEDIYPLRLVDSEGRALPPGEYGQVVVSNLVNRTTVVLNYRLGDIASFLPQACPCGRSLPLMSFPVGRKDDWVRLPNGGVVHGHIMNSIMRGETAVYQFQIVQLAPAHFRVSLIVRADADRADLETRLISKFKKTLGESIKAEVYFVASIPRTAAGKVRPIVSLAGPGAEDAHQAK
jgi:phenylacetate-CoA ligase